MDDNTNPAATVAKVAIDKLTNEELAAMNICAQLNMNPAGRLGYDKVKHLFTEKNGQEAHDVVKGAFAQEVNRRL